MIVNKSSRFMAGPAHFKRWGKMSITCNHCQGTGFLNIDQVEEDLEITINPENLNHDAVLEWIVKAKDHDVQVCDCCGDGEDWYGTPGEHYNSDDLPGDNGPYDYNGGLCECN